MANNSSYKVNIRLLGLLVVVFVTILFEGSRGDTYQVGDDLGWTIPPLGNIAYSSWAKTKSFDIGDVLVFQWSGTHNVAEVSKADYDACTATNPINGTIFETSPVSIALTSNETRYFICTISNHCQTFGQKVTISMEDRWWDEDRWNSANKHPSSSHFGAFFLLFISIFANFL